MDEIFLNLITESWRVLGLMAPYLLFGFLIAGVLSVWLPPEWVERHLGGRGLLPVLKASLLGVPLPLCSCGVIPVAASIRRQGAGPPATTAFLLSTPQTGVDSIAVTWSLLGPLFSVFRPLAALATGIIGGIVVWVFGQSEETDSAGGTGTGTCQAECCSGRGRRRSLTRALRYGLVTLPRDLGGALLVGIVIAGAITALIPPGSLQAYLGQGAWSVLLLMAAGLPVYVCATASVPIVAGLIHLGASPGAALAFLIAGPASNAAAFTSVWKILGRRSAGLYITTIAVSAFGCGIILDWLAPGAGRIAGSLSENSSMGMHWYNHLAGVVLLAVLAFSSGLDHVRREGKTKAGGEGEPSPGRQELHLLVSGMTCSHCAVTVKRALEESEGVQTVRVELKSGRVVLTGNRLEPARLIEKIEALGYQVVTGK